MEIYQEKKCRQNIISKIRVSIQSWIKIQSVSNGSLISHKVRVHTIHALRI